MLRLLSTTAANMFAPGIGLSERRIGSSKQNASAHTATVLANIATQFVQYLDDPRAE
jgi:hypothetical protein